MLLVGRGQLVRDVWGVLEGLAVEKIRIRARLLVVLGEESGDELLLAELVRLHDWGPEGGGGEDERDGLVLAVNEGRAAKVNPRKNWISKYFATQLLRQQITALSPPPRRRR